MRSSIQQNKHLQMETNRNLRLRRRYHYYPRLLL